MKSQGQDNMQLGDMLKEFGSEKLIGMLHAFVLLKPVIDKAIRQKEQSVLDATDLLRYESIL